MRKCGEIHSNLTVLKPGTEVYQQDRKLIVLRLCQLCFTIWFHNIDVAVAVPR